MLLSGLQNSLWVTLLLALLFAPLERLLPARRQRVLREHLGTDFLFLVGQHLGWSVLALAILSGCDGLVRGSLPSGLRESFSALPRAAQLVGVVLLGDLSVYWFHRACHRFTFLWRFHAVHHSSQTLDWVAAHREHPVDGVLTQLTLNLPAMLLGFPVEGLAALAVFRGLWATFIHSNVNLPLGPLRYLFGAPDLHHWHHAKDPGAVANYGNLSPWTDLLFGTFHQPRGEETWALGVQETLPTSWPGLMLSPFKRRWADSGGLLQARVLGPLGLVALVMTTFGGQLAFATPDGGSIGLGGGDLYLPATKSFGTGGLEANSYLPATKSLGAGTLPVLDRSSAGEPVVMGNLSKDAVQRVVERHRPAFRACVNAERLDGGPAVEGKVVVKFVVDRAGAVAQSTLTQTTVNRPRLEACVVESVKAMKFPPPRGGGVAIVTYPFVFAP